MKQYISIFLGLLMLIPMGAFARTPNDPFFGDQWYLEQIQAMTAWDTTTGDHDVLVAVLDTGIDMDHEDLVGQIFVNAGEIPNDGIDNDHNGYIDDNSGWDFYDDDRDPNPVAGSSEEYGIHHGTVVAGVIGATGNNSVGVTGVNWDVGILPIRVLDSAGNGDIADIIGGIDYALSMNADVINMSFVGGSNLRSLDQALQRAYDQGVVVVAAMGNVTGTGSNLDEVPLYPACSVGTGDDDVVIGVVSTGQSDKRSPFSNYGRNCADISAPGEFMYTTEVDGYSGGWNGTSLASPVVSGAIALMKAVYPNATPKEIQTTLKLSVDPVRGGAPSGVAGALGSGRLNIARAMEMLPTLVSDKTPRTKKVIEVVDDSTEDTVSAEPPPRDWLAPIAVGAGAGDKPKVTVFDYTGERSSFMAYGEGFRGGVKVATGQLDDDDGYEVVTGAGPGGGPHIRVFNDSGELKSQFFAFDAGFSGGVDVTVSDMNGDGIDEIIVVPGSGLDPVASVFTMSGWLVAEIDVESQGGLLSVSAGDIDGDGVGEIIVSEGQGSAPIVQVYRLDGVLSGEFYVYGQNMYRGVQSSVISNGKQSRIVVGTDDGAGPHVRIFDRIGALAGQFFAFDESNRNGVDVSIWDPYGDDRDYILTSGFVNGEPILKLFDLNGDQIDVSFPLIGYTVRVNI